MQEFALSTLDSGLRVVSERLESVRSIALGFWIGAGSRDEAAAERGLSHFIEHLLFKGSTRYDALAIAQIFDGLGTDLNAATSKEFTMLYTRVLDLHLERALDVMVDMLAAPTFAELDAEREVVLEEIAMVEDDPQDVVHDLLAEAVFGDTAPLGQPVLGTEATVAALQPDDVAGYHRRMYVGGNIVLAAAGNVDHDHLATLVADRLAGAVPGPAPRAREPFEGDVAPRRRFTVKDTEQYHVCLGATGLERSSPDRFALALLDSILGGAASSRLFQEIREKRGLAYSVYSFSSHYADAGQVGLYCGTRAENLATCLAIAREQIDELAAGGLADGELDRAKESLKGRLLLSLELSSSRMSRLGKSVLTGTEMLSLDQLAAEIDAVEADQLAGLAGRLFAPDRLSAAGIGPDRDRFDAAVEGAFGKAAEQAA